MPHTPPLIRDIAALVRDLTAACRRDPDGVVRVTLPEVVKVLGDLGIILVDAAGAVL